MEKKYLVIVNYIVKEINKGTLKANEKVPSIREITDLFNCSMSTAIRAYKELEHRKILISKPKSGYFVLSNHEDNNSHPGVFYDFLTGKPDNSLIPYDDYQICFNEAIEKYKDKIFTYHFSEVDSVRTAISEYLKEYNISVSPKNLIITTGIQQALDILIRMPFPNSKEGIVVEQPSYHCFLEQLKINGSNVIGIKRTDKGIDLDKLESIFRSGNIKFFYTMTRFQHPTGFSYTIEERKSILFLAKKYNVYIVEDDHLGDLQENMDDKPISFCEDNEQVIYLRSFSKTLIPSLRLGFAVLPELLINTFKKYKFLNDVFTSLFSQYSLEVFLRKVNHLEHFSSVRRLYSQRLKELKGILDNLNQNYVKAFIPERGFYAWFELPRNVSIKHLKANLHEKKIYVGDTRKFFLPDYVRENTLKLSITKVDKEGMEKTIPAIFDEIQRIAGKNSINSNVEYYDI